MSLRDEITRTVQEAGIQGFAFLRPTRWNGLLEQIAECFLKRGIRDLESVWIWNEFRNVVSSIRPADPIDHLRQQLEPLQSYWFLASDEHGKYWAAESTGSSIVKIIEQMHCFEYYVIDHRLRWILCENHHGTMIRANATSR